MENGGVINPTTLLIFKNVEDSGMQLTYNVHVLASYLTKAPS